MTHASTLNATLQELGAGIGIAIAALFVRLGEPLGAAVGLGTTPDAAFRIAFILLAVLLLARPWSRRPCWSAQQATPSPATKHASAEPGVDTPRACDAPDPI
jgi:hypothetical protein